MRKLPNTLRPDNCYYHHAKPGVAQPHSSQADILSVSAKRVAAQDFQSATVQPRAQSSQTRTWGGRRPQRTTRHGTGLASAVADQIPGLALNAAAGLVGLIVPGTNGRWRACGRRWSGFASSRSMRLFAGGGCDGASRRVQEHRKRAGSAMATMRGLFGGGRRLDNRSFHR